MHVTLDGWLTKYQQGGNKIKIQNSENRWEIVKKKKLSTNSGSTAKDNPLDGCLTLNTEKVLNYDSFYSLYIPHMSRIQLQREHLISLDSSVHRLPLLILYPFHLCCMKYLNHRQHRKMNQACASFQHIIYKYLKLYFMKDK
jgi:hypothetical protein